MKKLVIVAKVLRLIFLYCLYYISFALPRKSNKWVFGSYSSLFIDNPKFLFIYVNEKKPEVNAIWITTDHSTCLFVRNLGFKAYMRYSLKGLYHCLTAKIYYFNRYVSDINYFTSGGAILINLWHGVGLKKIEFNTEKGPFVNIYKRRKFFYRILLPQVYKRPTYFISSTQFQSVPFAKAFRIPLDSCLNLGYPRNDFLLMQEEERREFVRKYEPADTSDFIDNLKNFKKVYIYMPTWRETKTSFLADTNIDFHLLNDILKKQGELLILKLHVNTSEKDTFSFLSNIVLLPAHIDVYCILPYTNTLITDYSSVLYDYILLPDKQVILYLFDLEEYLKHREFNYPFLSNVSGTLINSASDLYSAFSSDKLSTVNNVNVIRDRFWGDYDGNASKRIVEKIYTGYI